MSDKGKRIVYGILGILFFVGIDQVSKYLAVVNLKEKPAIPIISGVFELQYLENHGAAFGLLQHHRFFLLAFTLLMLIALIVIYMIIPAERHYLPMQIICILIGAGAVGNMIDRFIYGYVVDFFYFRLINFPIFNVADCYVTVSCVLVLFLLLFYYKEDDFAFLFRWVGKDKK